MTSLKTAAIAPPAAPTGSVRAPWGPLALVRPWQWVKNGAVLLPLLDPATWGHATWGRLALAVAAFVLASSMVYAVNDIADRERDRHHPVKRKRPIPSGAVSVPVAALVAAACGLGAISLALAAGPGLLIPVGAYAILNLAYSRGLRDVPVLELFIVAVGFPLRALAGYQALEAPPSSVVILSTLFMSLLLVLGKRRRELEVATARHRRALRGYTPGLLDQLVSITAGLGTATFLLFALGGPHAADDKWPLAMLAVPLLVAALFRYLQRIAVGGGDGDPTRLLLRDPVLIVIAIIALACIAASALIGDPPALFAQRD